MTGVVYSETVIFLAPAEFLSEAPYQIAIVDLDNGKREMGRVAEDRVSIGDRVALCEHRNGVPIFRKTGAVR
jgi:uncharacterized OB-fold protein